MKKKYSSKIRLNYQNEFLVSYIMGLIGLLLIRDIGGVSLNKYIIVAFCCLSFFCVNSKCLVYMLSFTFPLLCGLPGTYIMLVGVVLYMAKKKNLNIKQIILVLFLIFMESISLLSNINISIANEVKYLANAICFFWLVNDEELSIDYKRCIQCYIGGIVVTIVIIMIAALKVHSQDWLRLIANGTLRLGDKALEESNDLQVSLNANGVSFFCVAGITQSMVLLETDKKTNKLWDIFFVCVCTLGGFLTLSRTFILVIGLCLGIYCLVKIASNKGKILFITVVILCYLGGSLLIHQFPEIIEGISNRFNRSDMATANGRFELLEMYWAAFLNDARCIIFGAGVVNYREVMGIAKSMHNGLEQILVCFGVPGAIVFLLGWLNPVFRLARKRISITYWIPFLAAFLYMNTGQMVSPEILLYPHLFAIYALKFGQTEQLKG